jgi:hypothetical protein
MDSLSRLSEDEDFYQPDEHPGWGRQFTEPSQKVQRMFTQAVVMPCNIMAIPVAVPYAASADLQPPAVGVGHAVMRNAGMPAGLCYGVMAQAPNMGANLSEEKNAFMVHSSVEEQLLNAQGA